MFTTSRFGSSNSDNYLKLRQEMKIYGNGKPMTEIVNRDVNGKVVSKRVLIGANGLIKESFRNPYGIEKYAQIVSSDATIPTLRYKRMQDAGINVGPNDVNKRGWITTALDFICNTVESVKAKRR